MASLTQQVLLARLAATHPELIAELLANSGIAPPDVSQPSAAESPAPTTQGDTTMAMGGAGGGGAGGANYGAILGQLGGMLGGTQKEEQPSYLSPPSTHVGLGSPISPQILALMQALMGGARPQGVPAPTLGSLIRGG